jgi:hypothetical protein
MTPVPLASLAPALSALTDQPVPNYRSLWMRIADGSIPSERIRGRHYCDPRAVAIALGLLPADTIAE